MHAEFAALCEDPRFAGLTMRLTRASHGDERIEIGHGVIGLDLVVDVYEFARQRELEAELRESGVIELHRRQGGLAAARGGRLDRRLPRTRGVA